MNRNIVLFVALLVATMFFVACEKEIDYNKLEGSTWAAEADNVVFTLRFLDKSVCSIVAAQKDETFSADLTTYSWRYRSDYDSILADFFIQPIDEEKGYFFFQWGGVENKKLYLLYTNNDDFNSLKEEDIKRMCFSRVQ